MPFIPCCFLRSFYPPLTIFFQTKYKPDFNSIEEEIGSYIRFEEQMLYPQIQAQQLQEIKKYHKEVAFSDKN